MPLQPYFENDGITLYHGDCRAVPPELPSNTFDLTLTDPPYLVSYAGRWGGDGEPIEGDSDPSWVEPVYREIWRVLKADSLCLSFYGWPHAETFLGTWKQIGFPRARRSAIDHCIQCSALGRSSAFNGGQYGYSSFLFRSA